MYLPAPIGIFIEADQRWKQLQAEHQQNKPKFYGLSQLAPTPSITTIQQLGLGIVHAFSTLILNSYKKLVYSQNSPSIGRGCYRFIIVQQVIVCRIHILCMRLYATIHSLKQMKCYHGIHSLLDDDACRWLRDEVSASEVATPTMQ